MQMRTTDINEFRFDDRNANRHTKSGSEFLRNTIDEFGFGRSAVSDKNNVLMIGNDSVRQAIETGRKKAVVVETTGDEIVIVKRTDIAADSREGRELAWRDNRAAQLGIDLDMNIINELSKSHDIDLDPYDFPKMNTISDEELAAFFEPDTSEPKPDKSTIVLNYSPEEAEIVKRELLKRGNSYEQAVWNLLGLE